MSNEATVDARAKAGKYLTFRLAEEVYGLEILNVREIIGMVPITAVPNTPVAVKGVINLRGKIVPVVDLRLKFNMSAREYTRETCIVVVDIRSGAVNLTIGVVVDSVCEVVQVEAGSIEPPPSFGIRVDTTFLLGMARSGSEVRLLLDIEKVLNEAETKAMESAALAEEEEEARA